MEDSFKELNHMVSAETLLNYPDCTITFTVHTYASDKKLGDVINQNNNPIVFLNNTNKLKRNNTNKEKGYILIKKFLNKFHGIFFG